MADRIDAIEEEAGLFLGPASVWRLRNGLFAAPTFPDERIRYVTATLELPGPMPVDRLFMPGPGKRFRTALRWAGFDALKGPTCVPLIIQLPPKADLRSLTLGDLIGILKQPLLEALPDFRIGEPGFRLRLGAPVAQAVVALDQQASARQWQPDAALPADEPLAVVAVIDDGLPFAHRALRDPTGRFSRVEFCWLQGNAAQPDDPWPEDGSIPTGRELFRGDSDALIATHGDDEDVLYDASGAFALDGAQGCSLRRFASHGAHVLGATAAATAKGAVRFIGVQLAPAVTLDTAGDERFAGILQAMHYVLDRADRIAAGYGRPRLPLIVNFSYGYTGGSHDGLGRVAQRLRDLLDVRVQSGSPVLMTLPAGNAFQSRLNGRLDPGDGAEAFSAEVPWALPASDRTPSQLELWFAPGADLARLEMTIVDPQGTATVLAAGDLADPAAAYKIRDRTGVEVGRVWSEPEGVHPTRRGLVVSLVGTDTLPGQPQAAAGRWRLRLRAAPAAALAGPIDVGIQRDFDPLGYRRGGRQSWLDTDEPWFEDDGTWRVQDTPGALITRFGSLNDLATDAAHTIVVGGTVAMDGGPAVHSSAGRLDAPAGLSVDCAAPVDESAVLPGVRGIGTRSGSIVRLTGTSVAAPQVGWQLAAALVDADDKGQNKPNLGPDAAPFDRTPDMVPDVTEDPALAARRGRRLLDRRPRD